MIKLNFVGEHSQELIDSLQRAISAEKNAEDTLYIINGNTEIDDDIVRAALLIGCTGYLHQAAAMTMLETRYRYTLS